MSGVFLRQWLALGDAATAIFGPPTSREQIERSPDGELRRVQYFERLKMEARGAGVLIWTL